LQEQARRLLVVPEQGLGRTPLRFPKRLPLENPERVPVRKQKRRLLRHEDRVQLRAQVLNRDRALLRLDELGLARGLVMGPERGHERPLYPVPLRLLLQMPEQGSLKGQARVQASPLRGCHFQRVRSNERRMQNLQRQERESA
jgi:hypothetical protein